MSPPWLTFNVAVVSAKLLTWSWPRCGTRRSRWRPNRSHAGAYPLVSRFGGRWNGRRAMFSRQCGGCGDTRAWKTMCSQALGRLLWNIIILTEKGKEVGCPQARNPTTSLFDVLSYGDFGFISWGNQEKQNRTQILNSTTRTSDPAELGDQPSSPAPRRKGTECATSWGAA